MDIIHVTAETFEQEVLKSDKPAYSDMPYFCSIHIQTIRKDSQTKVVLTMPIC